MAAAAVTLTGLTAWWLIAHLPRPAHTLIGLPGTDPTGRLRLDLSSVADAAAKALDTDEAITSANAAARREHGRDILAITATTTPDNFTAAIHAATHLHTHLASVLSSAPTPVRTQLHLKIPRRHHRTLN